VQNIRVIAITYFVKFFVKLAKLCSLGHDVLVDHEWWLDFLVAALSEEIERITD